MSINVSTLTPASLKAKEVATEEYVDSAVSNVTISDTTWQTKVQEALDSNTTTIDGSRITTGTLDASLVNVTNINASNIATGTIDAALINVTNINASNIATGVIYNAGGNASNYTMKIDLNAGVVHIR